METFFKIAPKTRKSYKLYEIFANNMDEYTHVANAIFDQILKLNNKKIFDVPTMIKLGFLPKYCIFCHSTIDEMIHWMQ